MRNNPRSKIASTVGSLSQRDAKRVRANGGGLTVPLFDLPPPSLEEDERYTTRDTIDWCKRTARVDAFDLDVAACEESHHAPRFYTKTMNGLALPWDAERVWCNPPYSNLRPWVERAWQETASARCSLVAMLIPANRTEQTWWQRHVEPYRDGRGLISTHFLPGRTAFARPGSGGVGQSGAPFGCVLLVWRLP